VVPPRGLSLDRGATAKALAADRIAARVASALGCGAMVSLGGDVAVAGEAVAGGWRIGLGEDHEVALVDPDAVVSIVDGALATSGTTRRAWRRGGRTVHHIVDPRTGDAASRRWRAVTVAARSCVEANTASTAAVVLGAGAPAWLTDRGLPARLVGSDGAVVTTAGWPAGSGG
jgi:FAD:protein FMN transferase